MSSVAVKLALVGLHTRPRLARAVHFGWDFAPPLPSLGIWKGLRLRAFSSAAIDSVLVTTAIVAGRRPDSPTDAAGWAGITWETSFTVFITGAGAAPTHGVLRIDVGSGLATASVNVSLPPGPSTQRISCNVTGAAPWWPRTLGAAPLYNATVTLVADVLGAPPTQESDSRSLRLGFREVSQLTPPAPNGKNGTLLRYAVNGVPVWIKGANWVPPDMFLARASR